MSDWKEELRRAQVDVDAAMSRFSNKEERYIKYLKLFRKDNSYQEMVKAVEEKRVDEAFSYCHTLKGIVGNLGFTFIYQNMYEACEILRGGSLDGVKEYTDRILPNYNMIINVIDRHL